MKLQSLKEPNKPLETGIKLQEINFLIPNDAAKLHPANQHGTDIKEIQRSEDQNK